MLYGMRITITLDDDLARRLERRCAEHSLTFTEAVNDVLRAGLAALDAAVENPEPRVPGPCAAVTKPLPLGRRILGERDLPA